MGWALTWQPPVHRGLGEGNEIEWVTGWWGQPGRGTGRALGPRMQLAMMRCRGPGDAHFFPTASSLAPLSHPPEESDVFGEE